MNNQQTQIYPVGCLPEIFRKVIFELHYECGVPIELVAPLVLGVASIACQGSVDVARPNCEPSSCSINIAVIVGSGGRKSTVMNKLMYPVHAFEDEFAAKATARVADYEAEQLIWDEVQKGLVRQITRCVKKGESVSDFKDNLAQHIRKRPVKPQFLKLIYVDPTPEAVRDGMCSSWPYVAVVSAEAGGFFNGRPMGGMALWNKIWDGTGVGAERVTSGSASHNSPRGTLLLAVQEGQFNKFCDNHGAAAMDIGFLPRFLLSAPPSLAGTRFLQPNKPKSAWIALDEFQKRVKEILDIQGKKELDAITDRIVLKFSNDAEFSWIESYNKIEALLAPNQQLSNISGFASKIAENIARVAAIFHFFSGEEGDISQASMYAAIGVCEWHTFEFMRLFPTTSNKTVVQCDAETIEKWLLNSVYRQGKHEVGKNHIRQSGPIRHTPRLNNALDYLHADGKILIRAYGNEAKVVVLHPLHFLAMR